MISIIAAIADNMVIGSLGALPWKLPADMKYFREVTIGNTVIMGRMTFNSIRKPLSGRRNIVVTSNPLPGVDVEVCDSFEKAIAITKTDLKVFVIGGSRLYEAALPVATSMYLTRVRLSPDGDTYFPKINWNEWELKANRHENGDIDLDFEFWTKKK